MADFPNTEPLPHAHLVGVAGVGMNALAQALAGNGWTVTGSDRYADEGQDLDVLRKLELAGVRLLPQNGSGITGATQAVVVSTAIESGNPDRQAADRLGVPIRHRSEMLAGLLQGKRCLAVAGTSGKTTVTGMVGWILEQAGLDPTVVNGGIMLNWMDARRIGSVRLGRSDLWVIEADESDRSFLRYTPEWALITNISADHFDLAASRALFDEFRERVRRGIVEGLGWGGAGAFEPELAADGVKFCVEGVAFSVPMPGRHNAGNALQAARLCECVGVPLTTSAAALARFQGIHRRLECVGVVRGIRVVDEYAHNPAKIAAAWQAVAAGHRRVLGFWRPHGFGPLALMFDDLVAIWREVCRTNDKIFVLPVYYAGGTAHRVREGHELAAALSAHGLAAEAVADYPALQTRLMAEAQPGDVVLGMGARDPELPRFARRLVAALGGS